MSRPQSRSCALCGWWDLETWGNFNDDTTMSIAPLQMSYYCSNSGCPSPRLSIGRLCRTDTNSAFAPALVDAVHVKYLQFVNLNPAVSVIGT